MAYSVMLAKEYSSNMKLPKELIEDGLEPPIGWFLSEKFDGYRAIYDNIKEIFVSRAQNIFNAPDWFKKAISSESFLDGELWVGRENFQEMGVVRKKNPDPKEWINVKYVVYDMPLLNKPFHKRLETLKQVVKRSQENWLKIRKTLPEPFNNLDCPLIYTEQYKISSMKQFQKLYERVIKLGGEGVMIKHPESQYEDKRSNYLLKYKPNFDAEGIIMDYSPGKGKYKGMLGGFICKPLINKDTHHIIDEDENHEFCISGMDDDIRANYKISHPVGTIISYEHSGLTNSGKPRFARYIRKRDDVVLKDKSECVERSVVKRDDVIRIFGKLYEYEKSRGEKFKANAYGKAISSLKTIEDDSDLTDENMISLNGIGQSLLTKINEILSTGTCPMYDKVKDFKDPKKVFEDIHAVGPKKAKELVDMGFKTIDELKPNFFDFYGNRLRNSEG